jgi:hypothetical protein
MLNKRMKKAREDLFHGFVGLVGQAFDGPDGLDGVCAAGADREARRRASTSSKVNSGEGVAA